jgi:cyanate permease
MSPYGPNAHRARIAERVGTRSTVIFGSLMIGLGLSISTLGPPWPLWIGHGLFIGLIGIAGINAPLYICVRPPARLGAGADLKRHLCRRRDLAAGIEQVIANYGWRQAMLWYALAEIVVAPLAAIYFRAPPEAIHPARCPAPVQVNRVSSDGRPMPCSR